jgi:signal transduction histidine kinase
VGQVTAAQRCERVLVTALAVSRAGCLGVLVLLVLDARGRAGFQALPPLVPVAAAESVLLVAVAWWRGTLPPVLGAADAALSLVLLASGEGIGFYNYVLVAALALGLPRWPAGAVLAAAGVLAAATAWSQATVPARYPWWNIVPNALAIVGVAGLTWALAAQFRYTAGRIDAARAAAVARSAALARERERARQARALRERVLATLRLLAERGAVTEPAMRAQLVAETGWLERFVAGTEARAGGLLAALGEVAQAPRAAGLVVRLEADPGGLPAVPADVVEAVAGAVWEALTNVTKHAGVAQALVRVESGGSAGGLVVEVSDAGRGFDPARAGRGAGLAGSIQARLAEVGGAAEVRSAPGAGTTVRLVVPAP